MRRRFVVTYDVCDQGRLRQVLKVMKGFGQHAQYSVFVCDLSELGLAELRAQLLGAIDATEDQVLLIDVGLADGRANGVFQSLGRPYHEPSRLALVV